jgi:cysteine-rich repeat protein
MSNMHVYAWRTPFALCLFFALISGCGGGGGGDETGNADTGAAVEPGADVGSSGAANPCDPNPCAALGVSGRTNCIRKSGADYDCVCSGFHEDDGEGGCKLRPAEASGVGLDEATDWDREDPTYNATIRISDGVGRPIAGAKLSAKGVAFAADPEGIVRLADQPAMRSTRYDVRAEGYAPSSVDVTLARAGLNVQKVELSDIELSVEVPGRTGGTLKVQSATIRFPPDAFVGGDGFSVQGGIQVEMSTVDPSEDRVASGPELVGEDDAGNKTALTTLGMVYVSIKDAAGEPVGLMPNRRATISVALPANTEAAPGDKLALQSYDAESSAWRQEGECAVEAIPEEQRAVEGRSLLCRGSVGHFSWWAVTKPKETLCLNQWVTVEHSQRYVVTRTLRLTTICSAFGGSSAEHCMVTAGDGKATVDSGAGGDESVDLIWEDLVNTVLPPDGELPASTCSVTGLSDGLSAMSFRYRYYLEASDQSDGGDKKWFMFDSEDIEPDTVAGRLGAEQMHAFVTAPAELCRSETLCTQVKLVINLDELSPLETADGDGDGFANVSDLAALTPLASILTPDCDDGDPKINPAAEEPPCSRVDVNCDGMVPRSPILDDSPHSVSPAIWHRACELAECAELGPEQAGNLWDEDCDGVILDADADGFVADADLARLVAMGKDLPLELRGGDCDDSKANVNPDQLEIPHNALDDACDGTAIDADGDGYIARLTEDPFRAGVLDPAQEADLISMIFMPPDCDDRDPGVNPAARVTVENGAESSFARYYRQDGSGRWTRLPGFCTNFHPETGQPLPAMRALLKDMNCDGLVTDLDGDGWTVPGDHSFGAARAKDCNDLDPRVRPPGPPESAVLADCAAMPPEQMVDELDCPAHAPRFIREVGGPREGEPVCPNSPSGLPTECTTFIGQETRAATEEKGCVFSEANASNPPTPPSFAGRLYGACGNYGSILPPCSDGVCGGPLRYSDDYVAELNRLFAAPFDCEQGADGRFACDTKQIEPGEWLGMCFPRCDICWGRDCATDNPCAIPRCDASTGQCQELLTPANGIACDDGNPCTGAESCWEGECVYQSFLPEGTVCVDAEGHGGSCDGRGECVGDPSVEVVVGEFCQIEGVFDENAAWGNTICEDLCLAGADTCPRELCACGTSVCGDGKPEGHEGCDDGNVVGGDVCPADCLLERHACQPGHLLVDGACEPCEAGTYCTGGATAPEPCASGTFDHDADPASECQGCGPGSYCHGGAAAPEVCPAGSFDHDSDPATECSTCAQGSSAATLLPTCECAAFPIVAEGEDTMCGYPSGNCYPLYSDGSCAPSATVCSKSPPACCQQGTFCSGGDAPPAGCPGGTYDHDGDASTACAECPNGLACAGGTAQPAP